MNFKYLILFCAGVFLVASIGCGPADVYSQYELGDARNVVATCVESSGGLAAWQEVEKIDAAATITFYGEAGQANVDGVELSIDIKDGSIIAKGASPDGSWTAIAWDSGKTFVHGSPSATSAQIASYLPLILHRARGAMNLLGRDETVASSERMRLDGFDVIRVGVAGNTDWAIAYYFDSTTCELRFVTGGSEQPGTGGTVTSYQYKMLPDGITFPTKIRVLKTGQYVLVGEKPLLELEFSQVIIH